MNLNLARRRRNVVMAAVVIIIAIVTLLLWPRHRETLVIVDGQEYQLASFAATMAQLDDQNQVDSYLLTITYEDPDRGTTRTTINVPRYGLRIDTRLTPNTVVWDSPVTLEGETYRIARWNPRYLLPEHEKPALIPEQPPTRHD